MSRGIPRGYRFKSYTCPQCGKTFRSSWITKHIKTDHKLPKHSTVVKRDAVEKKVDNHNSIQAYMDDLTLDIDILIEQVTNMRDALSFVLAPEETKEDKDVEFFPTPSSPLMEYLQSRIARVELASHIVTDILSRMRI